MENEILVSICAATYNHEKYIKDALDSFLMQNANFKYEIIICDDASTDNTTNIILEYQEKYPDIIVPLIQKENLYQQGIHNLPVLIKKAKGKYLAFCECDDYWCDDDKLQKQVDILENNKELSACVHNTVLLNLHNHTETQINMIEKSDCLMDTIRVLKWEENFCFHLSSMMVRKAFVEQLPDYYLNARGFGDFPFALHLSTQGPIYFIAQNMSVYRKFTEGSWSERCQTNIQYALNHKISLIEMFETFDRHTHKKYHLIIKKIIQKEKLQVLDFKKLNNIKLTLMEKAQFYSGHALIKIGNIFNLNK